MVWLISQERWETLSHIYLTPWEPSYTEAQPLPRLLLTVNDSLVIHWAAATWLPAMLATNFGHDLGDCSIPLNYVAMTCTADRYLASTFLSELCAISVIVMNILFLVTRIIYSNSNLMYFQQACSTTQTITTILYSLIHYQKVICAVSILKASMPICL